jgi:hypothetical protein
MMYIFVGVLGLLALLLTLWDAFETIILPRRVTRSFRLVRLFYLVSWKTWSAISRWMRPVRKRESYLSYYGPLSLLFLFAFWAITLVVSFAVVQWAIGTELATPGNTFPNDLYLSGSTFFTLGLGDVLPHTRMARVITIGESGVGFGFLAVVISYLPTLYGAFSQRELNISLLDARAGSPPTAAELLRRHAHFSNLDPITDLLRDWEIWSAQLMESHLSYPVLCYFRSQHDNQSWLAAFTVVLDVSSLIISYSSGVAKWQAQMTFAISRHAIVDIAEVLRVHPIAPRLNRLPPGDLEKVRKLLLECGAPRCSDAGDAKLKELRAMYEGYLNGLSARLLMALPSWGVEPQFVENWKRSAWGRISSSATGDATTPQGVPEH